MGSHGGAPTKMAIIGRSRGPYQPTVGISDICVHYGSRCDFCAPLHWGIVWGIPSASISCKGHLVRVKPRYLFWSPRFAYAAGVPTLYAQQKPKNYPRPPTG